MLIGSFFKSKRIEKGLSKADLAALIATDFQESLLWDFESGDDSDIDGWPIQDFKKYCEILDIEPSEYALVPVSDLSNMPLPMLIKSRREEMGYSIQELSELIGFEEDVIIAIEEERNDTIVALVVIKNLSLTLGLPFQLLLDKI